MDKKYLIIVGGILIFFVIVILGVVFLSGGGGNAPGNNEPIELVWWKTFDGQENMQEITQAYSQLYKNVKITYVKKDPTTYEQELVNAIASGNGPDILTIHNDWLPKHGDKLAPMPVTLMNEKIYRETFLDVAAEDFIKDNRIYAVPMSVDALALYYNKDILNSVGITEPPKTWEEVKTAVQKITRQETNGDFIRSGIAMGTSANVNRSVDILSLLMLQNGTQFYGPNQDVTLDTSYDVSGERVNPAANALDFYTQFANPGKKTYTWNSKSNNSIDAFSQSKVGMMISYSYMREIILDKAPNLNLGIAPVPQVDNTGLKVNFANYWGEAVSNRSKNPDAAWNFLNFLTQKDNLLKYYAKHKLPASRKDTVTEQFSDLAIGVFAEAAPTAKAVRKSDAPSFEGIFIKMIDDVVLLNQSASESIFNGAQQLRLLPKR